MEDGAAGGYYHSGKAAKSSAPTYDREILRRVWEISEKMTGSSRSRS
jgi:hypothetical protein